MPACFKVATSCKLKDEKNELFGYPCDGCRRIICKTCSGFSVSDVRCIPGSARVLIFFCPECVESNRDAGIHHASIEDKMLKIEEDIDKLLRNVDSLVSDSSARMDVVSVDVSNLKESSIQLINLISPFIDLIIRACSSSPASGLSSSAVMNDTHNENLVLVKELTSLSSIDNFEQQNLSKKTTKKKAN
ncbi:hypothetical protein HHI36_009661 [Cryptolaemus montrouzieri]|uniref:FYVE-type domain-containing protein n=1 Tax=Cryptolaemus montrouzieri TaxID=559131 RepID=A0ABD2MGJ1_9CUCU